MYGQLPNGQSSPGILQSGQLASNGILQMPQLSSFAIQRQVATPVQPEGRTKLTVAGLHERDTPRRQGKRVNIGHDEHNRAHEI